MNTLPIDLQLYIRGLLPNVGDHNRVCKAWNTLDIDECISSASSIEIRFYERATVEQYKRAVPKLTLLGHLFFAKLYKNYDILGYLYSSRPSIYDLSYGLMITPNRTNYLMKYQIDFMNDRLSATKLVLTDNRLEVIAQSLRDIHMQELISIIDSDDIEHVKCWCLCRCPINDLVFNHAIFRGNLEIIKVLYNHTPINDASLINIAI